MMRAVSATHHQLQKYPTSSGMANIRGDQAMARTIVAVARKRSDWAQSTSQASPNKDSSVDKKQKKIVDQ